MATPEVPKTGARSDGGERRELDVVGGARLDVAQVEVHRVHVEARVVDRVVALLEVRLGQARERREVRGVVPGGRRLSDSENPRERGERVPTYMRLS